MRIILLENIKKLGNKGDLKEVAEGYAANFLLPRKLAEIATPEAIKRMEINQEKFSDKQKEYEEKLKKLASEIEGKKILIKAKAEKGKLFGSIGTKEITQELKKINPEFKEDFIVLTKPLKNTGEKDIIVKLNKNIKTKITVAIEKT